MVTREADTTRTQPSRMLGMFPHAREVTTRRMIWFREKISHGSATATGPLLARWAERRRVGEAEGRSLIAKDSGYWDAEPLGTVAYLELFPRRNPCVVRKSSTAGKNWSGCS